MGSLTPRNLEAPCLHNVYGRGVVVVVNDEMSNSIFVKDNTNNNASRPIMQKGPTLYASFVNVRMN